MFNGAEILTKFTADTSQVDKATKGFNTSVSNLAKGFAVGELAAKGISKAIGLFNENLDSAIKRTDTLNNFPKVMSNLGISAEDSRQAIDTLSEKLTGLPTSLDSAAMAVQRFTSKNGDVNKSTQEFLALNNALLAGGASADVQSTALEQISQAYAKGKPDMMEWRSMMTAMPAQLKQVATAMGYVDTDALGEALRDGTVSMDDFMQAVMKLNTEGLDGFQSFEEQARNSTGGIQTSITNMKTAFTRGVADIISRVNESLEEFGGLSGVISKIGKVGESAFKVIGTGIQKIMPIIINITKWIVKNHDLLEAIIIPLAAFIATFMGIAKVVSVIKAISGAMTILNAVMAANPIGLIIAAIVAVIAAVVLLYKKCEWFRNGVKKVIDFIKKIIESIKPIVSKIFEFIKIYFQTMVAFWTPIIEKLIEIIKNVAKVVSDVVKTIYNFVVTYINTMFNVWKTIATWLWNNVLQPIINYIKNGWEFAYSIIKGGIELVKGLFTLLKTHIWDNTLKPLINNFQNAFTTIYNFISGIVEKIYNRFTSLRDKIKSAFEAVKTAIVTIFEGIVDTLKKPINGLIDKLNDVIDKINSIEIAGHSANIKRLPKLATGTNYVPQDMLAMIHEGEAVVPKKFNPYANGINASTLASMGGRNTIIVNVENNMEMDSLGQMVNRIKTYSGGSKNDYNFGIGR